MYNKLDLNINTDTRLVIVIGLPGAGKTTLCQQIADRTRCQIHDDFITHMYNGRLIDDLQTHSLVWINDPRLCQPQILNDYMPRLEAHIPRSQILLILFPNDADRAVQHLLQRDIKPRLTPATVCNYSKLYDLNNYTSWSRYVIDYGSVRPTAVHHSGTESLSRARHISQSCPHLEMWSLLPDS